MTIHIKVCGISDVETALACEEAGVDAIGFVFANSVRRVTPETASAIVSHLSGPMQRVAVFHRPRPGEVDRVIAGFHADLVQADHGSPALSTTTGVLPVFREDAGVEEDLEAHLARAPGARFVYEGPTSGAGRQVDWDRACRIASMGQMTLAGGLTPGNVGEAIHTVRPFGVDVSSGVEAGPGRKDPRLIEAFVAAARRAALEVVS